MKILITGVSGFIGFSLAKKLLEKGNHVIGIDNINNYYSTELKKKRIKQIKKFRNFKFYKIDINDKKKLKKISSFKFEYIFHFAAQPGVRYSLINPSIYYHTNVLGFQNVFDTINYKNLKKAFYASSSSVYGDQKKFPIKENFKLNAKNPYGMSKIINENLAELFSYKYTIPFIGLRLFTVYGEWGRPDMFILKLLKHLNEKKIFNLNNSGYHFRDFTYIEDVTEICNRLMKKKFKTQKNIYNLCANDYVDIHNLKEKILINFPQRKKYIKNVAANKADVFKTHGSNYEIIKVLGKYKFKKINYGLKKTIEWFLKNSSII